jgi:alpha-ketoglutarate-dependent dioxygenase alkB family protein 2
MKIQEFCNNPSLKSYNKQSKDVKEIFYVIAKYIHKNQKKHKDIVNSVIEYHTYKKESKKNPNYKPFSEIKEEFKYYPKFISNKSSTDFIKSAETLFPKERSICTVYGKKHEIPRDQVAMGKGYVYSGSKVKIVPMTKEVSKIKKELEQLPEFSKFKLIFDTILINGYNGSDKVGWHSDNEKLLNKNKPIISVSFGTTRDFDVRLTSNIKKKWRQALNSGDVVIMMPGVQQKYQHHIPPRSGKGRRYNLTFRMYKTVM